MTHPFDPTDAPAVENAVQLRGLSVDYDGQRVLDGVDLAVPRGEFLCVVGLSGSGKTTLLLAAGRMIGFDGDVQTRGRIGVVFQQYATFPWLTVRRNIAFGLRGLPRQERQARTDRLLRLVGLVEHAGKYPAQLSGGQKQRVAVARAMAQEPNILLMDEPFGALDVVTRAEQARWLASATSSRGQTVLFTTHSLDEALLLGDRVMVIARGKIVKELAVNRPRPRTEDDFGPGGQAMRRELRDALMAS